MGSGRTEIRSRKSRVDVMDPIDIDLPDDVELGLAEIERASLAAWLQNCSDEEVRQLLSFNDVDSTRLVGAAD